MAETTEEETSTAYVEESTSLVFPFDLSEVRYMQFDFFSSEIGQKSKDVAEDLSAKGIATGGKNFQVGLIEANKKVESLVGETFASTAVKKASARADAQTQDGKEYQLSQTTKDELKEVGTKSALDGAIFKYGIYLPLVNNMRETLAHGWKEDKGMVAGVMSGISPIQNTITGAGNVSRYFGARPYLTNPDYVQTYEGSSLRTFVLSWVLMPNSDDEASQIFEIIRVFKRSASPERALGGSTLLAPLFVQITIQNEKLQDSVKMDEMVITQISVNYSETGFMETFSNGTPKAIMLELTVAERRMRTEADWGKGISTERVNIKKAPSGAGGNGSGINYNNSTATNADGSYKVYDDNGVEDTSSFPGT